MSHRVLLGCGMLAGLAFCTQVCAAVYDMTSCYSGPSHVIQQGDGIVAGSYDLTAMIPGQEGTPYYKMSGRCVARLYRLALNGKIRSDEMTRFIYALKEIRACLEAELLNDVQQRLALLSREMENQNGHRIAHQPTFARS